MTRDVRTELAEIVEAYGYASSIVSEAMGDEALDTRGGVLLMRVYVRLTDACVFDIMATMALSVAEELDRNDR